MADTTVSDQTVSTENQDQQQPGDVREHPAFKGVLGQLAEARQQLEKIKAEQDDQRKAEEQKKLEEKGQYETLLQQLKAEQDRMKSEHTRQVTEMELKYELMKHGCTNEMFVAGAVATYDGQTPIGEYVKLVAESNEAFFRSANPGINPPQSVSTGTGPKDWKTIKQHLGNTETAGAAGQAITEYFLKTGELPPGLE